MNHKRKKRLIPTGWWKDSYTVKWKAIVFGLPIIKRRRKS